MIRLGELVSGLGLRLGAGARPDVVVRGVTDDSREVDRGFMFIARQGLSVDGGRFIASAIEGGAGVIVSAGAGGGASEGVAWVSGDQIDQALVSELAGRFHGHPSRKLKLIGVTGTNGKTTIAFMVRHLLNAAGLKCGMVGTVVNDVGGASETAGLTSPGAAVMQRLLGKMVSNGCAAAVCEMSSHALHQKRTAGLDVDVAVFTNLTGDHLDYHGSMDAYAGAKALLFEGLNREAVAVVNGDDGWSKRMVRDCGAAVVWCGVREAGGGGAAGGEDALAGEASRAWARIEELGTDFSVALMAGPWGERRVRLPVIGRHNVSNALQALVASQAVAGEVKAEALFEGLASFEGVPGRLESVRVKDDQPTVLVDYAHTDDALRNVLSALRPVLPAGGELIVVFGCGGDRDRTKRPRMAAVACELADRVVVTSDNPRTEQPGRIIEDVMQGVDEADVKAGRVRVIEDRAMAIREAVSAAGRADVVVVAGKGHEDYQIVGREKVHFDDREEARAAIEKWGEGVGG